MSGDSMVKDFAETLEFYGEHERLGLPPIVLARYLIAGLSALTDTRRALPVGEPARCSHAEDGAVDKPETEGAQNLFPSSSLKGSRP